MKKICLAGIYGFGAKDDLAYYISGRLAKVYLSCHHNVIPQILFEIVINYYMLFILSFKGNKYLDTLETKKNRSRTCIYFSSSNLEMFLK